MLIEPTSTGMGVALLPKFLAADAPAAGRPVRPFDLKLRNEKTYYIVHRPGMGGSRMISLTKEWLLEEVQLTKDDHNASTGL